jgi:hypothetical protein
MKMHFCIGAALLLITATAALADPPLPIRLGSGEKKVERYAPYGYNAVILGDVTQMAMFDDACPGAIAPGTALRKRLESQRAKFVVESKQAQDMGLQICMMTDEASLPIPVLQRIVKNGADPASGINFDSEAFWTMYRAKYREVLKAYPQVAYVMVRTGENYSHPDEGFIGHTVYEGGYDDAYVRHMARMIEETRKIVVDEFGRQLIWRTWDLGNDGFHANTNVYDRVLADLPARKGLILAVKHTQTDFWRYNDFNPMIGRGNIDQIIEFQCAREYEGKGSFPNYVGPIHAADMKHAAALGAKGAWVWDFAGGWGGPILKSDRWVRLNIFATSQLAQNPGLDPRDLAQQWAAHEYGDAASTNVAEMLMLSGECIRKGMYIEAYARTHTGWKPSLNLLRDDIIRGEPLKQLYEGSSNSVPEVVAEKEQAVAIAGKMRALFESSRADIVATHGQKTYDDSLSSLISLQGLMTVLDHYVSGMFEYYQWQDTHDPAIAARAEKELEAWRTAWNSYQTDIPKLPGVATIYRSENRTANPNDHSHDTGAMADLCEAALQSLAAHTAERGHGSAAASDAHPAVLSEK